MIVTPQSPVLRTSLGNLWRCVIFGVIAQLPGNHHATRNLVMDVFTVTPFASAMYKTSSLKVADQFSNLSRHKRKASKLMFA
jgi:hypothetical protein